MKTRFLRSWKLVIVLAGLPLAGGSLSGPGYIATAEETVPADAPSVLLADQSAPQPTVSASPNIKLSSGAAEIAKLAQAGLGEDVMMAYVGNVNSSFNLGSDQIVYLNDLGVSGSVVKAMIQRDAQLTSDAQAWAAANQAPVAPPIPSDDGAYPTAPVDNSDVVNPGDMVDNMDAGDNPVVDDTGYFHDTLAPYGTWLYVSGAGLCWQPTVCIANRGWQPYFDRGRWMYTDCGWYWRSDYSWGWAAFHYGRWFNDGNRGWVWKPDHVWGPAWVSWRHSADYCGWAPLPPSAHFVPGTGFQHHGHAVPGNYDFGLRPSQYTFIPVGRMTDYSPYRYAIAPYQATELFHQSVVANHVTFENNRVVSHGIDPRQVAMASGIEVRTAEIHETPRRPNTGVVSEHLAKQGDSLMIFRPQLSPPSATSRPRQLFAPPTRNPAAPKASLNNPFPNTAGPQTVASAPPLPRMNFAATASASPGAKTEFYPSGSLVVIGQRSGNNSQASVSTSRLPNMNFAHQAVQSASTYASIPQRPAYEPPQYNYHANYGTQAAQPAPQAFEGYHQQFASREDQFAPGQSQVVIPSHFSVASRLENHSAYTAYGSGLSEPVAQHHASEAAGDSAPVHHSANVESHAGHVEHSAPATVSHSSPSSSSGSGHH